MLHWSPWRKKANEGHTTRNSIIVFKLPRAAMFVSRISKLWRKMIRVNCPIDVSEISGYQRTWKQWWASPAHFALPCGLYILRVRRDHIPNSCNTRGGKKRGWVVFGGCLGWWDVVWKLPKEGYFILVLKIIHVKQPNWSDKRTRELKAIWGERRQLGSRKDRPLNRLVRGSKQHESTKKQERSKERN